MLKARARRTRSGAPREGTDDLRDSREDTCAYVRGQVVRRVGRGHAVAERPGREEVAELQEDIIAYSKPYLWSAEKIYSILLRGFDPKNARGKIKCVGYWGM